MAVTKRVMVSSMAAALVGCGGGGGGGPLGNSAVSLGAAPSAIPQDLTTLSALTEVSVNSGLSSTANIGTGVITPLSATTRVGFRMSAGQIVEVALVVPEAGINASFTGSAITQRNDTAAAAFVWADAIAIVGNAVHGISILNPDTARLNYHTLGSWANIPAPLGTYASGYVTLGAATPVAQVPTSGTASYAGLLNAAYTGPGLLYEIAAQANATADFATRAVTLTTSGSQRLDALTPSSTAVADSGFNLSGTLNWTAGTNQLSGILTTGNGLSGPATAKFFGPAAEELGGTFDLSVGGSVNRLIGGFGLSQP